MRRTMKTLGVILALAAGGSMAQSQTKVYGFADAQFNANFFSSGMAKQFVSADTFEMELKHANVYFDFKPNDRVSALVEIAFLDRPQYTSYNDGSRVAGFTYQGRAISDDQAKAIITEAQVQAKTPALVQAQMANIPTSYPQSVRDSIQGVIQTQVEAQVRAAAAPQVSSMVDQIRSAPKETTSKDKLGLNISRAYVDLHITDPFKLRVGKFITPAGIWNVDHGSPVVLTVRQPIQTTTTPIFPEAQTGAMGFGNLPLGDHDLNYSGYITGGRIDGASTALASQNGAALDNIWDLAYGGHLGLKLDVLKSVALGASYYNGPRRSKYQVTEVTQAIEDLQNGKLVDADVKDVYTKKEREYAVGGDLKVEISNLLVQGEVNYGHNENELADGSVSTLGWYGLVAWTQPVNDVVAVTPYAMYESVTSSDEGVGASGSFKAGGLEGFATIVGGVNLTLFSNLHLKTEYTYLTFTTVPETWMFREVKDDDLTAGIWSTQVSVAF